MFKKILIAEDIDNINIGMATILEALGISDKYHAQYCDEAYLKARNAILNNAPFDLLICDLSFKADHRSERLTSGKELIIALKKEQPNLKVIVYSIEDNPQKVKSLKDSSLIDGYVCKDRKGLQDLTHAIKKVYDGGYYLSPQIESALNRGNLFTLKEYELRILTLLANGLNQEQIAILFKKEGIQPNSKSSIEKHLKELKEEFNAQTTIHLINIVKDLSLI
ncbi:DNA-binding response regulator [Flavobacteriaceae bacterium R38]|nr:DNA-binding response regulator [Flavobacteriaceae bacterium R38]